jgi:hypothetical protein
MLYRKAKLMNKPVPRILGLTATLIKKNVSKHVLNLHIERAETLLDSIAVTYENYPEVLK